MIIIQKTPNQVPKATIPMPSKKGDANCVCHALADELFAHVYRQNPGRFEKQFCPGGSDQMKKMGSMSKRSIATRPTRHQELEPQQVHPSGPARRRSASRRSWKYLLQVLSGVVLVQFASQRHANL